MVRLTDRPDMTLDVYRGRKTTMQHQPTVVNLTGRTETGLITGSDQPVRAVVSCNC